MVDVASMPSVCTGSIHVELLGRALVTVEGRVDPACACSAGEPSALIDLKPGTRIWIAAGFTDLRRGFQRVSSIVESVLEQATPASSMSMLPSRGSCSHHLGVSAIGAEWSFSTSPAGLRLRIVRKFTTETLPKVRLFCEYLARMVSYCGLPDGDRGPSGSPAVRLRQHSSPANRIHEVAL
jgi:hypothetical protein